MKKRIALIILFVSIFVRVFAGEYVYWEDHKQTASGRTIVHMKICCPKGYTDNAHANDRLRVMMNHLLVDGEEPSLYNVTEVLLPDGIYYRIVFGWWDYMSRGAILIFKGNDSKLTSGPLERIYLSKVYSYNSGYYSYQSQCDKYLNML